MGQSAEELTTTPADIEATRSNLTHGIDELTDKVSPSRVLDRRKEAAKGRFRSIRDKVMGSATETGDSMRGTVSSASESISDTATGAMSGLESRAQGNPLAAGVVAFGAGMLLSALIPASDKEAQAAQQLTQVAKEKGQPLIDEARSVGQRMAADLKESAADSAQQVQTTAQDSVANVKQEGQSSAQTVKDEAAPR